MCVKKKAVSYEYTQKSLIINIVILGFCYLIGWLENIYLYHSEGSQKLLQLDNKLYTLIQNGAYIKQPPQLHPVA